jgi:hypothetical protein
LRKWITVCSERESFEEKRRRIAAIEAEWEASPQGKNAKRYARVVLYVLGISLSVSLLEGLLFACEILPNTPFIAWSLLLLTILWVTAGLAYLVRPKEAPEDLRKLKAELADLESEMQEAEDGERAESSGEEVSALAGDQKEFKALTKKFDGVESAEKLRAMYNERRELVRGIVGPEYLARPNDQEAQEDE